MFLPFYFTISLSTSSVLFLPSPSSPSDKKTTYLIECGSYYILSLSYFKHFENLVPPPFILKFLNTSLALFEFKFSLLKIDLALESKRMILTLSWMNPS